MWGWLQNPEKSYDWMFGIRVVIKAIILFILANLIFAWADPMEMIGRWSIYDGVVPPRNRLPYSENADLSYSVSLDNIPAMFATHVITNKKAHDEFRVLLMGDSGTWGWLLNSNEALAAQINKLGESIVDGRQIIAYNLGYPILSLTKDLLLLDYAMQYEPDLIIWLVTLESFPREKQMKPLLVRNNRDRAMMLISAHKLNLDANDPRFRELSLLDQTIIGRQRELADWLRLQTYGFAWAATGIDHYIPEEYKLRSSDFDEDISWQQFDTPAELTEKDLAFEVLAAGVEIAGDAPVIVVNEPMFISTGENSNLRYNHFYPRWAYDQYRELITQTAADNQWNYLDLWDVLPADEFTDTPVHTTAAGAATVGQLLVDEIVRIME